MTLPAREYQMPPTLFDRVQDELSAIQEITNVLGSLPDQEARMRVVRWMNERFARPAFEALPWPDAEGPSAPNAIADAPADADSLMLPDAADLFAAMQPVEPADSVGMFEPPAPVETETAADIPAVDPPPIAEAAPLDATDSTFELAPSPVIAPAPAAADNDHDAHLTETINSAQTALLPEPAAEPVVEIAVTVTEVPAEVEHPPAHTDASPSDAVTRGADTAPHWSIGSVSSEPPPDSMEAMLRSLVADFRQLADEWGNT